MIEMRKLALKTTSNGSVVFDPNFLGTQYARKVYVITNPRYVLATESHVHEAAHYIVVLDGDDVRLAYKDVDGVAHDIKLVPGHCYHVPPNVPHQIVATGCSVTETYFHSSFLTAALASDKPPKIVLAEDLFEQARQQAGAGAPQEPGP